MLARAGRRARRRPGGAAVRGALATATSSVVQGAEVRANGTVLATGRVIDLATASEQIERQRERINEALADFAVNTIEHVEKEGELLVGQDRLPAGADRLPRPPRADRRPRDDLPARPADAARLHRGHAARCWSASTAAPTRSSRRASSPTWSSATWTRPPTRCSPAAPRSSSTPTPTAARPGASGSRRSASSRSSRRRSAPARTWRCCSRTRTGAELIVSVGAHFNLTEFLDKNRAGMSSTFLTRLRIGETLVDAKGVSRLYNPGVRGWHLWAFLAISLVLIAIVVLSSPALAEFFDLRLAEDQGRARTSDGLLGPLSRRLARGRLPRARGRDPDRRRLRLRHRQRDRRRPRAEPRSRPRRRARARSTSSRASSPTERDFSEAAVPGASSTNRLRGQRGRRWSRSAALDDGIADEVASRARARRGRRCAEIAVVREPPDLDALADRGRAPAPAPARETPRARSSRRASRRRRARPGPRRAAVRRAARARCSAATAASPGDIDGVVVVRDRPAGPRAPTRRPTTDALEDGLIAGIQGATRAPPDRGRRRAHRRRSVARSASSPTAASPASTTSTRSPAGSRSSTRSAAPRASFGVKDTADALLPDLLAPRAGCGADRQRR